ncbi:DUF6461 domain-containing protein [Streptomyces ardesiacus]|uniref:DUF6461 domain-containing protein n=1 Tax=Streptomyces ardesiacus TaxID=285564 RepID=UPI003669F5DE
MMSIEIFPSLQLYDTGYCIIFAKSVQPEDLLLRVTGGSPLFTIYLNREEMELVKALGEDIEPDDVPHLNLEELESAGILDNSGPLLRSGMQQEWSFIVEPEGSYLAADAILESASSGTVALCARLSETGSSWISYAESGEILSSFDPLFPDRDYGKRPEVLDQLTGHRNAIGRGERSEAYENALHQIQQRLGCVVPPSIDADRLPAVRVPDQY